MSFNKSLNLLSVISLSYGSSTSLLSLSYVSSSSLWHLLWFGLGKFEERFILGDKNGSLEIGDSNDILRDRCCWKLFTAEKLCLSSSCPWYSCSTRVGAKTFLLCGCVFKYWGSVTWFSWILFSRSKGKYSNSVSSLLCSTLTFLPPFELLLGASI